MGGTGTGGFKTNHLPVWSLSYKAHKLSKINTSDCGMSPGAHILQDGDTELFEWKRARNAEMPDVLFYCIPTEFCQ